MSEYQYYEFQAIDQPLTPTARKEMQGLSSRVQLTASSASFVYHYSDFPGIPETVLGRHFDMMLHINNMGTRRLMFRFPASAVDLKMFAPYEIGERYLGVQLNRRGDHLIVDIEFNDETGEYWGGWIEGEGLLAGMVQLRDDIMRGDLRALYLGWLKIAQYEYAVLDEDEDFPEPPVPPHLKNLSPALHAFIDFFELDRDLVDAAAQASSTAKPTAEVNLASYLDQLSIDEMRNFLARVLKGERHLDIALRKRLIDLSSSPARTETAKSTRTVKMLFNQHEQLAQARLAEAVRQAELARLQHLKKIETQETSLWTQVHNLIRQKKTRAYEEAIVILQDLKLLAEHRAQLVEFEDKMQAIKAEYSTLNGLHSRMKNAKLLNK